MTNLDATLRRIEDLRNPAEGIPCSCNACQAYTYKDKLCKALRRVIELWSDGHTWYHSRGEIGRILAEQEQK